MADKENQQISMAASAIAMRGVRLFLSAGKAAAQRRASPPRPRQVKTVVPINKLQQSIIEVLLKATKFNKAIVLNILFIPPCSLPASRARLASVEARTMPYRQLKEKTLETLYKSTHFTKNELEALFTMYRRLVTTAQSAAPASVIGQPASKVDGIDQNTFRDVMHNTFDLVTEDVVLDRVWLTWERGANGGEGALKFEAWARGLSVLLRGTDEERRNHCFAVYDLNSDGFITRDEMFTLLKNSLLKQPGDEDPDEGVRDLVELVLRKMDIDKDGKLSIEDYKQAVRQEPLLLEAFGQCLPSKRHAAAFLKTLANK